MTSEQIQKTSRQLKIINERGLHARASHKFVETVLQHDALVTVSKGGRSVNGDEIMELLLLSATTGCTIDVEASGADAEKVIEALNQLVSSRFGEKK